MYEFLKIVVAIVAFVWIVGTFALFGYGVDIESTTLTMMALGSFAGGIVVCLFIADESCDVAKGDDDETN